MFRYSWVEPDADRRSLARIAGQIVAHDLGLTPVPQIRFFDKDPNGSIFYKRDVVGFVAEDSRLIGIHIGLIPQATLVTICHECGIVGRISTVWRSGLSVFVSATVGSMNVAGQ